MSLAETSANISSVAGRNLLWKEQQEGPCGRSQRAGQEESCAVGCEEAWQATVRMWLMRKPQESSEQSVQEMDLVFYGPPEVIDPKDSYLITRSIMAEPDYIEDDNPELIRPQKLINPVKTSRNHQDLHRELLMNQKRGLAPQNKPELQKVMEKRKRDQVIKQKEEEAQKKKSDLEIELLKRQQKLEQLELEKQKLQEEQENAPEFVKVKGNLRRTGQEVAQAQES
ncbi:protein FAM107B isoform X1 [Papio anubis]|uniref:protein FAM107B isoform X1 n=1 Tax=Papio anubis TaxID=9555 RepID=UPI0012ADE2E8|nr:protein FAM107B isoform X1 [Papio anubis]